MAKEEKESAIEKISGNVGTNVLMTSVAVSSGLPIAAFLPLLTDTIASGRHKKRIQDQIDSLNDELEKHKDLLQELSDANYKLMNEAFMAIFQTVDDKKMKYLRQTVLNSIKASDLNHSDAYVLARIIRDISAEEIEYLINNIGKEITLSSIDGKGTVKTDSNQGEIIMGLISLALIIPVGSTMDEIGIYKFSPIAILFESIINL